MLSLFNLQAQRDLLTFCDQHSQSFESSFAFCSTDSISAFGFAISLLQSRGNAGRNQTHQQCASRHRNGFDVQTNSNVELLSLASQQLCRIGQFTIEHFFGRIISQRNERIPVLHQNGKRAVRANDFITAFCIILANDHGGFLYQLCGSFHRLDRNECHELGHRRECDRQVSHDSERLVTAEAIQIVQGCRNEILEDLKAFWLTRGVKDVLCLAHKSISTGKSDREQWPSSLSDQRQRLFVSAGITVLSHRRQGHPQK